MAKRRRDRYIWAAAFGFIAILQSLFLGLDIKAQAWGAVIFDSLIILVGVVMIMRELAREY